MFNPPRSVVEVAEVRRRLCNTVVREIKHPKTDSWSVSSQLETNIATYCDYTGQNTKKYGNQKLTNVCRNQFENKTKKAIICLDFASYLQLYWQKCLTITNWKFSETIVFGIFSLISDTFSLKIFPRKTIALTSSKERTILSIEFR